MALWCITMSQSVIYKVWIDHLYSHGEVSDLPNYNCPLSPELLNSLQENMMCTCITVNFCAKSGMLRSRSWDQGHTEGLIPQWIFVPVFSAAVMFTTKWVILVYRHVTRQGVTWNDYVAVVKIMEFESSKMILCPMSFVLSNILSQTSYAGVLLQINV